MDALPSGLKCIIVFEGVLGGNHEGLLAQLRAHGLRVITCSLKMLADLHHATDEAGLRTILTLDFEISLAQTLMLVGDTTCTRLSEIVREFGIKVLSVWPPADLSLACRTLLYGPRTFPPLTAA